MVKLSGSILVPQKSDLGEGAWVLMHAKVTENNSCTQEGKEKHSCRGVSRKRKNSCKLKMLPPAPHHFSNYASLSNWQVLAMFRQNNPLRSHTSINFDWLSYQSSPFSVISHLVTTVARGRCGAQTSRLRGYHFKRVFHSF